MHGSILEIAQQHLSKVKPTGNENVMAICPFHRKADGSSERGASFAMNVRNGLWYCHSCHARGNLYSFLRDVGIGRAEITTFYADVIKEAEQYSPAAYDPMNVVAPTTDFLEESFLGMFDQCPFALLDEGYPEEVLRKFDVGYDERHQRITFPLRDDRGRLIGISGRAIGNQMPRYKVYDWEYKDFGLAERATEKRVLLWNAHNVLPQLLFEKDPGNRYVVVTEGFKSVMRVAQSGIGNVVGLLGSYMSKEQQQVLENMGCTILLMLDNNPAGILGQLDAGERLIKTVPRLYAVTYDAPQPSELGVQAIPEAIIQAQSFHKWRLTQPI